MATKPKRKQKSTDYDFELERLLADVDGLEKLQVMQLRLIREIRSQLAGLEEASVPS